MKGLQHIFGIGNIKSSHSAGVRSIPKIQKSSYLELYAFKREESRLEKEIFALDKRRNMVKKQLSCISKQLKNIPTKKKTRIHDNISAKALKTMSIHY